MNDLEFCNCLKIDTVVLSEWIEEGWIAPAYVDGRPEFRDADIARANLILDLMDAFGVNAAGIDIAMDLIDQVHGLRAILRDLMTAIEHQDREIQTDILRELDRIASS
ncbi:chaperone modulatory protein CbpM [Sinorhizobium kostiense]|uniref:Chaperone modulatory protein CbpM n=1 Tax=Sinorhizobium kostiense TaxID=76747 RepID=A0ABS4R400_9HYPH|nr:MULTISPECIES: chaperone modulator CbpM [Sinorhizobium]MBP2236612.1 chaperone modulatory protein CbpM [Sinorhizobium kostiense]